jgi:hypothetical protein
VDSWSWREGTKKQAREHVAEKNRLAEAPGGKSAGKCGGENQGDVTKNIVFGHIDIQYGAESLALRWFRLGGVDRS